VKTPRAAAAAALLAGLVATGCSVPADDDAGSQASSAGSGATGGKAAQPRAARLGQPVRDGKFEFVVQRVQCGAGSVGGEYSREKAQGQFCLVTMKVTNIGDEARTLDSSSQYAYDATGRRFDANSGASLAANENDETFINDINPGNAVTGVVVFDIPKNTKLAQLELHDSSFSGGVKVSL
jgi:hypothetical protein